MKIVFVSDAIYPYYKGSKEKLLFELSTRLAGLGHDVHIYTMHWWDPPEKIRVENGVVLHAISKNYNLYDDGRQSIKEGIMFALNCFKLLRVRFDVIDVDLMSFFPILTTWVVCMLTFQRRKFFGVDLIEAGAFGKPVIASNIGGAPNVVMHGQTGLLVAPGSSKKLSPSIMELLDDKDMALLLGEAGQANAVEHFSFSGLSQKTDSLSEELSKKQIIHITSYYPPHLGGMETAVFEMADRLDKDKFNVKIITSNIGGPEIAVNNKVAIVRLRSFEMLNTPLIIGLFAKLLMQPKRTIFHVHVAQAFLPEVSFIAAKLKRVPLVMHFHGDVGASGVGGLLLPVYKKLVLAPMLRTANSVIAPTESYKTLLIDKYGVGGNRIFVVPSGVDDAFFDKRERPNTEKKLTLLYVGRISVEKNLDLLIESVRRVKVPVKLRVIGDGPLADRMRAIAQGLADDQHEFEFLGRVQHSSVPEYLRGADALLLASDYESQSLVALEAMASSVPVIFSSLDSLKEVVKNGGICTEKNPVSIALAIQSLADNDYGFKLGQNGYRRACDFKWSTCLRRLGEVYEVTAK